MVWVIEGSVTTVRTAVSTEPDHAGSPQLLQHLPQLGMQLGKETQVEVVTDILVALQGVTLFIIK